jgi:hypothetical protein
VSPQEFLADPAVQDAVFDHVFGGYLDQYGPEGAARAWFGGPGAVAASAGGRRDVLGTSVDKYGQMFKAAYGGGAGDQGGSAAPSSPGSYAAGPADQQVPGILADYDIGPSTGWEVAPEQFEDDTPEPQQSAPAPRQDDTPAPTFTTPNQIDEIARDQRAAEVARLQRARQSAGSLLSALAQRTSPSRPPVTSALGRAMMSSPGGTSQAGLLELLLRR